MTEEIRPAAERLVHPCMLNLLSAARPLIGGLATAVEAAESKAGLYREYMGWPSVVVHMLP